MPRRNGKENTRRTSEKQKREKRRTQRYNAKLKDNDFSDTSKNAEIHGRHHEYKTSSTEEPTCQARHCCIQNPEGKHKDMIEKKYINPER
jgi:hypothetical protein